MGQNRSHSRFLSGPLLALKQMLTGAGCTSEKCRERSRRLIDLDKSDCIAQLRQDSSALQLADEMEQEPPDLCEGKIASSSRLNMNGSRAFCSR
jgi:hypothetical protein